MKKTYTKKQIQEAISYWKKQLNAGNYINESVEGMAKIKMNRIKQELEDSVGKMPDYKAFRNSGKCQFLDNIEKARFGLEIKYSFRGKISHYSDSGGHWDCGKISAQYFEDFFGGPSDSGVYVITIPEDASLDDFKQCLAKTEHARYYAKDVDDAVVAEVFDMVKGHSIADAKLSQIFRVGADIQAKVDWARRRQTEWLESQKFKIAFEKGMKDKSPFLRDGATEYGQIVAWMCRACGCKNARQLYEQFVSDEREEYEGRQTAVDDWDLFVASERDAISRGDFIKQLVEDFNDCEDLGDEDENGNVYVDEGRLRDWIEEESRDIVDRAWENFDYRDYQTYRGTEDVYY